MPGRASGGESRAVSEGVWGLAESDTLARVPDVQSAVEKTEDPTRESGAQWGYTWASLSHRVDCICLYKKHSCGILITTDWVLTRSPVSWPHHSEPPAHLPSTGVKLWLSKATSPGFFIPFLRSLPVLPYRSHLGFVRMTRSIKRLIGSVQPWGLLSRAGFSGHLDGTTAAAGHSPVQPEQLIQGVSLPLVWPYFCRFLPTSQAKCFLLGSVCIRARIETLPPKLGRWESTNNLQQGKDVCSHHSVQGCTGGQGQCQKMQYPVSRSKSAVSRPSIQKGSIQTRRKKWNHLFFSR